MKHRRRIMGGLSVFVLTPAAALAEPSIADVERFRSCVGETFRENADNFTAALGIPVLCGAKHIPYEQSCAFLRKLMAPEECINADHAYWKAETDAQLLEEGFDEVPSGSMLASGLTRCAETGGADLRQRVCETEVYWRSAIIALASPMIEAIQNEQKETEDASK